MSKDDAIVARSCSKEEEDMVNSSTSDSSLDQQKPSAAGHGSSKVAHSHRVAPRTPACSFSAGVVSQDPSSPEAEYILSSDLQPLQGDVDIHELIETLPQRLDSKDWVSVAEALNRTRQIAIFHTASMTHILGLIVPLVVKAMKNPRSALCKTAIMTAADFFKSFQDQMLDFIDDLLVQLLLKASQDKRFVCEEAEKALVAMTTWISPKELLLKLQVNLEHRNPRVRAKASSCVCRSVSKLGVKGIKDFGLETLIKMGASQLNDQLPEAREAARQLVMVIREAHDQHQCLQDLTVVEQPKQPSHELKEPKEIEENNESNQPEQWEQFCQRQLPPGTALAVLRATCVIAAN